MPDRTTRGVVAHPGVRRPDTDETAVYRLFDAADRLLYVGIAQNPQARWGVHAERPWWGAVAYFTVVWHSTRKQAADEERVALRAEDPLHNIQGTARGGLVTGAGVRAALARERERQRLLVLAAPSPHANCT